VSYSDIKLSPIKNKQFYVNKLLYFMIWVIIDYNKTTAKFKRIS